MRVAKAVVAAVGSVCTVAAGALADNVLSIDESGNLIAAAISAGATVYAVWRVPNVK